VEGKHKRCFCLHKHYQFFRQVGKLYLKLFTMELGSLLCFLRIYMASLPALNAQG
jgi:hypothetical protein